MKQFPNQRKYYPPNNIDNEDIKYSVQAVSWNWTFNQFLITHKNLNINTY